jgi:hypothetical protein
MIKDYQVNIRIKNNIFLNTLHKNGFESVAQLSRATGISIVSLGNIANLRAPVFVHPMNGRTKLETHHLVVASVYQKLCDFFDCTIWDLAPEQHFEEGLSCNSGHVELDFDEVQVLLPAVQDPQLLLENKELSSVINNALDKLTPREKMVIERRFGLNGYEEQCLHEVSENIPRQDGREGVVCKEVVRQVEAKALRKLRHKGVCGEMRAYTK